MDTLDKPTYKGPTYEGDFVRWLEHQAELLRAGRVSELDLENLAEEVESIGRSDKREVYNRLTVLVAHLLKYQFQPAKRSRSWLSTIGEQRRRLRLVLEDSPSLAKTYAPGVFSEVLKASRKKNVYVHCQVNMRGTHPLAKWGRDKRKEKRKAKIAAASRRSSRP